MRKARITYLALLLASAFALWACSEEDNTEDEFANWQERNETYWDALYTLANQKIASGDASWKVIPCFTFASTDGLKPEDYIVVKVLQEGTGTESPLFTDTCRVHYRGRLIPSTTYTSGYQFDSSWQGELNLATARPVDFAVNGSTLREGFATALQHMHVGDRWEVYMPYQLAYGTESNGSIPGYSTLIFDITLAAYWHPGYVMPPFKVKGRK